MSSFLSETGVTRIQSESTPARVSVIIADHDPNYVTQLQQSLMQTGYSVCVCDDGLAALDLIGESGPAIVLADWDVPRLAGLDLCRRLRTVRPDGTVYLILLTAHHDAERILAAFEAGADDYLLKFASGAETLARVRAGERVLKLVVQQRERASELEAIIDNHPAGIIVMDAPAFNVIRINQHACSMLHVDREVALQQSARDLIDGPGGGSSACDSEVLWKRLLEGHYVRTEIRRTNGEGKTTVADITIAPVRNGGGEPIQYVAFMQDITERMQAQETLRRAHARTEQLLTAISSILIGLDADERITDWNATAERAFGIKTPDVLGRRLIDCEIGWDADVVDAHVQQARMSNAPVNPPELHYQRPDGTEGVLGLVMNPLSCDSDAAGGVLIVGADITQRKHLEHQLAQAQKLESIGQLAAGIAHEINTPTQFVGDNTRFLQTAFSDLHELLGHYEALFAAAKGGAIDAALLTGIEAAREAADLEYLCDEIPQAITQSLEGIARVTNIVRAMKDFSHPGGREKQTVDLNKAIESTATVARNEWKYVADLVTDLDPDLPAVSCWVADFNQVILNMIVNAAHAIRDVVGEDTEGKGCITIATRRIGEFAEIRISDSGTGIPAKIRSKIFDPFFTTKDVGKGTGQGLAIAHSVVVEKHGGQIDLESTVGEGTTFIIRLPLGDEANEGNAVGTDQS